jgi:DnaJ homolog subfamily C member 8
VLKHARGTLLRSHDIPTTATDDDPKIASLTPPFKVQFRAKCKEMLIEEELRRRK